MMAATLALLALLCLPPVLCLRTALRLRARLRQRGESGALHGAFAALAALALIAVLGLGLFTGNAAPPAESGLPRVNVWATLVSWLSFWGWVALLVFRPHRRTLI